MVDLINIHDINKAYFIGIGGIGMSAIARYFKSRGASVSGYDKTPTSLTEQLIAEGIEVHFTDDVALFPQDADLVVYTPAIPADSAILNWCKSNKITLYKRSDVLQIISKDTYNICVAGTHEGSMTKRNNGKSSIESKTQTPLRPLIRAVSKSKSLQIPINTSSSLRTCDTTSMGEGKCKIGYPIN